MVYLGGFEDAIGQLKNHKNIKVGDIVKASEDEITDNEDVVSYDFTHITVRYIVDDSFIGSACVKTDLQERYMLV
jgi:hypothetical protein